MRKLAEYFTRQLLDREMIEQSQQEIYQYGLERLIGKIVNFSVILFLAMRMKVFLSSVLFLIFFLMLRGRPGGYHAPTEGKCFVGTILIYWVALEYILPFLIEQRGLWLLCMVVTVVVILLWAPVNHPHIGFSQYEMQQYKKRARIVLGIEILLVGALWVCGAKEEYYISAVLGMTTCAFLVAIAKIVKQEERKNEAKQENRVESN